MPAQAGNHFWSCTKTIFTNSQFPSSYVTIYQNNNVLSKAIVNFQLEKRFFHKNGRVIWVLLSVSLVWNGDNQPKYFIAQIQNISDRKVAEDAKENK